MTRRLFSSSLLLIPLAVRAEGREFVRGRIVLDGQGKPTLHAAGGKIVPLEGDEATMAVLRDPRVIAEEFEAAGQFTDAGRFRIEPIHKKAMFVRRGGRSLVITYWCDVCAIRTYSPGRCQCCQEEMALDPREPALENAAPSP